MEKHILTRTLSLRTYAVCCITVSLVLAFVLIREDRRTSIFVSNDTVRATAQEAAVDPAQFSNSPPEPDPRETRAINTDPVRVPILVYHGIRDTSPNDPIDVRQFNISPSAFTTQLEYLRDHAFTTITFTELQEYFNNGTPLPSKPIILSFDDGWHTQIEHALPLLTQYGMVATFFLYPNVLDHEHYMTWDDARSLVAAGMEIGSHSKSHQYMTKQDDQALHREIAGSKQILERELLTSITTFAYPFGLYSEHIQTLVEQAGYGSARSLEHGTILERTQRYALPSYLARPDNGDFMYYVEQAP